MSSWWKRFFSLDDDEDFNELEREIEEEQEYKARDQQSLSRRNEQVGRLEDPNRRVHVRMTHQYPEKKSRPYETYRQPASYQADKEHIQIEEGDEKKKPFTPTQVPSPVYGFRKPPKRPSVPDARNQRNSGRSLVQKEVPPSSPQSRSLMRNKKEPETLRELLNDKKSKRKSAEENPIEQNTHEKAANKADMNAEKLVPIENNKKINDEQESARTHLHNSRAANNENASNAEDRSDIAPANEKETNEQKRPNIPYKPRRRSSKVPYNVLMFRSDKNALQKQDRSLKKDKPSQENTGTQGPKENEDPEQHREPFHLSKTLLNAPPETQEQEEENWIREKQKILQETLENFRVKAEIVDYVQGPAVTRYEIRLQPGVKVNKVINLTEDIKLSMAAKQIRIAPVPGKNTVGIEIPNDIRKPVYLKHLLDSPEFKEHQSPLAAVLGQDISGENVVTDLAKMPHGLIAGATGSGKSVCIHSLILSLIYKTSPEMLRLILIDPKVVELAAYQKLPHLAAPVITQPKEASMALKWAVDEMERRYQMFADAGVRDIGRFNQAVDHALIDGEKMPYIVIVIDELADLMMVSPQDVEEAICRIAQKARAAGIHLLLATQRPSVDVITGLIKSNIPTRIAFSVSSQADSRTIIDTGGAERLLGQGDMLFAENGAREVRRLQGCFVSDEEIDRVTEALAQMDAPPYLFDKEDMQQAKYEEIDEEDNLFEEAAYFVIDQGQASVSSLQRKFRIGYNRAARLVDQLESLGVISEANGSKPRQVLMERDKFEEQVLGHEVL
ncbi:S-DNA-T family DNA segregation ATPase FtsK/SpoIIIE [Scopulibacillus daqui]|uniref:S-DNA-T family DNA segregation ATPase FtsK/SpoIIIE n=1 Tax=Scopulibacillus daqui TaxID=1469162 RepID=A0ABS2PXT5_9BACL|nr:DNA translocase FtsK [Scopulibacillus daqui]MBM7644863.1 S-DNA-T family DNA segregation ATPase FtsK/SpoIIIE [Scopulibacillus daqui]